MSYRGSKFAKPGAERTCPYCGSAHARIFDQNASHPVWSEMTGVCLFRCEVCHSHFTSPLPTDEFLSYCYQTYAINGYPAAKSLAKPNSRQEEAYERILRDLNLRPGSVARCLEIGAGEAHLAVKLLELFPEAKLDAVDFSAPPRSDAVQRLIREGRMHWIQADINRAEYGEPLSYDLVTAVALIEHVKEPLDLIKRIIALLKPGGRAFVQGPRAGSPAQVLFGKKWVYHIPGEHLSVPSAAGIRLLMSRIGHDDYELKFVPTYYSTKYLVNALAKKSWNAIPDILLPLPTGSFSLEIRKPS